MLGEDSFLRNAMLKVFQWGLNYTYEGREREIEKDKAA